MKTARRRLMKGAGCGCGVPRLFQGGGGCGVVEGFNACPLQGGGRRRIRKTKTRKAKKAHKKH
jgi:hypothetical protein